MYGVEIVENYVHNWKISEDGCWVERIVGCSQFFCTETDEGGPAVVNTKCPEAFLMDRVFSLNFRHLFYLK